MSSSGGAAFLHHSAQSRCPPRTTGLCSRPVFRPLAIRSVRLQESEGTETPVLSAWHSCSLGNQLPTPPVRSHRRMLPYPTLATAVPSQSQVQPSLRGILELGPAGRQPEAAGERCKTWESMGGHSFILSQGQHAEEGGQGSERQEAHRREQDVSDGVPRLPEAQLHPCSGRPPISFQYLYTAQKLPQASQACLKSSLP